MTTYNLLVYYFHLRGRVQFPTGGRFLRASAGTKARKSLRESKKTGTGVSPVPIVCAQAHTKPSDWFGVKSRWEKIEAVSAILFLKHKPRKCPEDKPFGDFYL